MGAVISQATYAPFIFSLFIGVPSLILYIFEVHILFRYESKFRSAYFRLIIVRFISNIVNYFTSYFYFRLGRLGLFLGLFQSMPSQLLAFFFFFNYYTFHADNLSTMFILLNRLTLLIFPVGHAKIWKYLLPISIFLTYLTPLSCTLQVLTYDFYVRLQDDNWTFTLYIQPKENVTYIASTYVAAMSALSFCLICGVFNILIIILYRRTIHMQVNLPTANTADQNVEARLTIYALITFIAQLSMSGYYILMYVASWLFRSNANFFLSLANQFCWVHDLYTIALPAWFLLWASSKVKECVCVSINFLPCFCGKHTFIDPRLLARNTLSNLGSRVGPSDLSS